MGTKLSIDKNVSDLDDILMMNPAYFRKIKFENKCPEDIACHLKVRKKIKAKLWKYYEKHKYKKEIVSEAISLKAIKTTAFSFKPLESYVVLLIYRKNYKSSSLALLKIRKFWIVYPTQCGHWLNLIQILLLEVWKFQ